MKFTVKYKLGELVRNIHMVLVYRGGGRASIDSSKIEMAPQRT